MFGRIGILMGGVSSEREISLKSGNAVLNSLKNQGLDVVVLDIKENNSKKIEELLKNNGINLAFITLHGKFGEDGAIQKILEKLKIPYTGSKVRASKLAMDKVSSRLIFKKNKLPIPEFMVFYKNKFKRNALKKISEFPVVVKPSNGGSSIGVSFVMRKENLNQAIDIAFNYDEKIIIEKYIKGRELTVGIFEENSLPVIEIVPKSYFFDYNAKYQKGVTEYIVPARLPEDIFNMVQVVGLKAHKALGCCSFSRVDIILNEDNVPMVLEVNTIPGLTETSLLPKAAQIKGIGFNELCLKMLKSSCKPR